MSVDLLPPLIFRQPDVYRVGANGSGTGSVRLSAGVDGLSALASDAARYNGLSGIGKAVVTGGTQALSQLGAGAEPGQVLAAASVYASTMLGDGVAQAAGMAASQAASLIDSVPLIGAFVNFASQWAVAVGEGTTGTIGGGNWQQNANKCQPIMFETRNGVTGTAPGLDVLPADIFMGRSVNSQGKIAPDAFYETSDGGKTWHEGRSPAGLSEVGALLRYLEESPPQAGAGNASFRKDSPWPNAGLTPMTRALLRNLRLGISAQYVDTTVTPPRAWSPGSATDGGQALWSVYLDVLRREFDAGRLTGDYLTWLNLLRPTGGYYGNQQFVADKFLRAASGEFGAEAKAEPLRYVRDGWGGAVSNAGPVCQLFTTTGADVKRLVDGWRALIQSPYSQYKKQLDALEPDSLGGSANPSWWDVLTAAVTVAALSAVAFAVVDPKRALAVARSSPKLVAQTAQGATRSAQGAARWAVGGVQSGLKSVSKKMAGG